MTCRRREKLWVVAAVLSAGWATGIAACTPATTDEPLPASGGSISAQGGSGTPVTPQVGAGANSPASVAGGAANGGAGPAANGGITESGGAPFAMGGTAPTAGASTTGGSAGASGGTVGSSGGAASSAVGCNWMKDANNSWSINPPASDKQVLFDGTSLSKWHRLQMVGVPAQWRLVAPDMMEVVPQAVPTNIQTNAVFSDVCLHVEYWTPPYSSGVGVQMQGNSGVYLKSAYEMQVLDTSLLGPMIDGCGAVYKVSPPLVVACTQHETWNSYEIEFKGSVWDEKSPPAKIKNAVFVQVALNGKLVQQNVTLNPSGNFTEAGIPDLPGPQPIALQDHRDLVRYRNIWAAVPKY